MSELKIVPILGIQKTDETEYIVYCTACWRHCIKYVLTVTEPNPNIPDGMLSTGVRFGAEGIDENCPYLNQ